MRVMQLGEPGSRLELTEREMPQPAPGEVLVDIAACGVCRTDLHLVDGELPDPRLPIVPGHEIVGRVITVGEGVEGLGLGTRVGIPWLAWTCDTCDFCQRGQENLCENALFTGYTRDGGYGESVTADARYCFPLPEGLDDTHAAPLLCAGLIGYRSLRFTEDAEHVGLYGFGAAAHIIAQVALHQGRTVSAFVRPGDEIACRFAKSLGVHWAGSSLEAPPRPLDAAIIFAPVGPLVPAALRAIRAGGIVVCAGIHMSDIPAFSYSILWRERAIRSVANLTRRDAEEFLPLAAAAKVRTHVTEYALEDANVALDELRAGKLSGAGVIVPRAC
jgi:propanol-preferring alcohol dehydrogenase